MATPSGGQYGGPQQSGYGETYGPSYGSPSYGNGQEQPRHYDFPSTPTSQPPLEPSHQSLPFQRHHPGQPPRPVHDPPVSSTDQPLVRPYAMTGGRTRPRYQLAIEALVSTSAEQGRTTGLLPEHQRIVQLCREIKSVAEISALLTIPLGVARILVADLAESGLVTIHQPASADEPGAQPDLTLLERVLSGLRKL